MKYSEISLEAERTGRWSTKEHQKFLEAVHIFGKNWIKVARFISTRNSTQVRSHAQKFYMREEQKVHPNSMHSMPALDKATQYGEDVFFGI